MALPNPTPKDYHAELEAVKGLKKGVSARRKLLEDAIKSDKTVQSNRVKMATEAIVNPLLKKMKEIKEMADDIDISDELDKLKAAKKKIRDDAKESEEWLAKRKSEIKAELVDISDELETLKKTKASISASTEASIKSLQSQKSGIKVSSIDRSGDIKSIDDAIKQTKLQQKNRLDEITSQTKAALEELTKTNEETVGALSAQIAAITENASIQFSVLRSSLKIDSKTESLNNKTKTRLTQLTESEKKGISKARQQFKTSLKATPAQIKKAEGIRNKAIDASRTSFDKSRSGIKSTLADKKDTLRAAFRLNTATSTESTKKKLKAQLEKTIAAEEKQAIVLINALREEQKDLIKNARMIYAESIKTRKATKEDEKKLKEKIKEISVEYKTKRDALVEEQKKQLQEMNLELEKQYAPIREKANADRKQIEKQIVSIGKQADKKITQIDSNRISMESAVTSESASKISSLQAQRQSVIDQSTSANAAYRKEAKAKKAEIDRAIKKLEKEKELELARINALIEETKANADLLNEQAKAEVKVRKEKLEAGIELVKNKTAKQLADLEKTRQEIIDRRDKMIKDSKEASAAERKKLELIIQEEHKKETEQLKKIRASSDELIDKVKLASDEARKELSEKIDKIVAEEKESKKKIPGSGNQFTKEKKDSGGFVESVAKIDPLSGMIFTAANAALMYRKNKKKKQEEAILAAGGILPTKRSGFSIKNLNPFKDRSTTISSGEPLSSSTVQNQATDRDIADIVRDTSNDVRRIINLLEQQRRADHEAELERKKFRPVFHGDGTAASPELASAEGGSGLGGLAAGGGIGAAGAWAAKKLGGLGKRLGGLGSLAKRFGGRVLQSRAAGAAVRGAVGIGEGLAAGGLAAAGAAALPAAAVFGTGLAADAVGSAIYNKFDTQIQDFLAGDKSKPSKPATTSASSSSKATSAATPAADQISPQSAGDPTKYLKKTDSNVDIDGLKPAVKSNLTMMAEEYYKATGKKIQVNSAYRSIESQQKLWDETPPSRRGKFVARPGSSMHNYGLAFDINSSQANELNSMGLLSKYGFTRPVNGEAWHIEPAGIARDVAKKGIFSADMPVHQNPGIVSDGELAKNKPGASSGSAGPVATANSQPSSKPNVNMQSDVGTGSPSMTSTTPVGDKLSSAMQGIQKDNSNPAPPLLQPVVVNQPAPAAPMRAAKPPESGKKWASVLPPDSTLMRINEQNQILSRL